MSDTTPAEPALYESRRKIFPKAVSGFYRRMKWWIMLVTLAIYYITPWLRWERAEGLPDQAVLIDLANRRFYFFFIEIWPQEFYFVAGLLVMAGIGLFLVTSVVGRAWCGYFCPQTVWTDLFMHVERFIDGDRNAQIRLEKSPWNAAKIRKRVSKHAIWLTIALLTGGAWVFYFSDAPTLLRRLLTFDAPAVAYGSIALLTATTYVLGGILREQVCLYMCPWPRIQGAMLDEHSLVVTYNDWRGEPRGKHRKSADAINLGDCIDCNACVAVCPTGVDIRDGQQIGCITCGLCIDACDAMMEKVDLPRKLISYSTLADYEGAHAGQPQVSVLSALMRPRTLIYAAIWGGLGLALVTALVLRDRLDVAVERDRNPTFVRLSDGSIRNTYTVRVANMRPESRVFEMKMEGLPAALMTQAESETPPSRSIRLLSPPDAVEEVRVFVTRPANATDDPDFQFIVNDLFGSDETTYATTFIGPDS